MFQRVLSPVLVGRQEELSQLEDFLLSANRGDGRFVLLAGEAGIGKTRLATELTRRARKLGCDVLWGSCSEAELALPYLPFVEAIGNHLDEQDPAAVRAALGPAAAELAQLFPQLAAGPLPSTSGDPAQAKLRLFESVVSVLELWAREHGLLLVLDDVHWADTSTRELLDYAARRLATGRVMVLATYRSDELDRRHPLTRAVQVWRRSGLAETVAVAPIAGTEVAEMIAAILNVDSVSRELTNLIADRSEGNPFVLEEMLREALDHRETRGPAAGWEPTSADLLRMPETVREAVLLRLGRLDPEQVDVLRAGALLGRSFDYGVLAEVAEADEEVVAAALESAVSQQLLEEGAETRERYIWRHALTQEAIAGDTVVPKRQRIHSRAADALARSGGSPSAIAGHLLGAGRTEEAIGACLDAAAEAERAVALPEAAELLERVLPNVADAAERALLLSRMGRLRWMSGEPAAGEQLLADAVAELDELGLAAEAARARIDLGRCRWELDQPEAALADFERARETLEAEGASAELALAYIRIAGIHVFELDLLGCRRAAQRAVEIAEEAGADFERIFALSHLALGYMGWNEQYDLLDRSFREALENDHALIAGNMLYNEIWARVHTLAGGLDGPLGKLVRVPFEPWMTSGGSTGRGLAMLALGRPADALEDARKAMARHESLGASKFTWRSRLIAAEALLELGRTAEAEDELPPPSPGNELQDIVYDSGPRIGIALELGRVDEAVELGRRAGSEPPLLAFRGTVALAVEGLLAGGLATEARELLTRSRQADTELGEPGLDLAEGRILLAEGKAGEALAPLERARTGFENAGLALLALRAQTLTGQAAAETGDEAGARELLGGAVHRAHELGAVRARDAAVALAGRLGVEVPPVPDEPGTELAQPEVVPAGERLITSMFADVRGYTPLASVTAPQELADRITTLHRWAAAEVTRRYGIVDKFAGDAVMATFNAAGTRVDHAVLALEAALALRDKAALMDLPVGIGIAVGPAVITRSVGDANLSVLGEATNLASRLESAAGGGEILLSDQAYRRVAPWLEERGLAAEREELELKGFSGAQPAYRLAP